MQLRWVALVLLLACGNPAPERADKRGAAPGSEAAMPAAPEPTSGTRTVAISEPPIALPRELAFELLDPGKGQRALLRYALEPAATTLVTRAELTTRQLVDGTWREPTKDPPVTSDLAVAVERGEHVVLGGGARALAIDVDVRGRVSGLADHPTGAANADLDDIAQRVLATVVPVPEQEVGDGARWRVVTALRQQGAVLKQTATYTLLSRGPRWKIAVDIQRLAEPQRVMGVELVAIVRRLSGTYEIDPAAPFPRSGRLAVTSTVHARSGAGENIVENTGSIELRREEQR